MKSIKNIIENKSLINNQIPTNNNQKFDIHSLITKEEITEPKKINEINITCIIFKNNLSSNGTKKEEKNINNENENSTSTISTKTQNSQENNNNLILNKKRKRNHSIFLNKRRKKKKINKPQNKENIEKEKKIEKKAEKINLVHENIKKKYTKEQYLNELNSINDNNLHNFMKENFPSMYNHINFYLYYKLLQERRKNKKNFLFQNYLMENYNINNIIRPNNKEISNENCTEILPEKVWSPPANKLNVEEFYKKCINVWPFNKCNFIKEIGLEYLMKNQYNIDYCLENLDKFVEFMIEKIKLKNYQLINKKEKIIKNYHLRNSKK
jgi:hypothetical protein